MAEKGFKRKLAAILSADVEGYSRLMGEDEEATVRTLTTYREVMTTLIQQHNGKVLDSPGDNLLAEFVSVVDAVQCAVAVQKEFQARNVEMPESRRMEFRIGINLGDVIEEKERIYGDGVNIAARLEGLSEPGGICISKTAFDHIESKLPYGYDFLGDQTVKNIAKPVGAYRVLMDPRVTVSGKLVGEKPASVRHKAILVGAIAVVVVAVAVGIWQFYMRRLTVEPASEEKMAFPLPDKPSIAVLRFDYMGDDPNKEYIANALSENIISALSKLPDLFIVAKESSFSYKGKEVKIKGISEELGVRYVLEGSLQKSGDHIRVTAQLIDAIKGYHVWSDSYDRKLKDFFALQDDIILNILKGLQVELTIFHEQFGRGTTNLEALFKLHQGLHHVYKYTKEDLVVGRKLYQEAIALDPEYAYAYHSLGWTYLQEVYQGYTKSKEQSLKKSEDLARKALELDPSLAEARALLAIIFLQRRQFEKAIAEGERAMGMDPNNAANMATHTFILNNANVGRYEEALALIERAIRINPKPPPFYITLLGSANTHLGRYAKAIEAYKIVLSKEPNNMGAWIPLTICYVLTDHMDEAKKAAAELLRVQPAFSIDLFKKIYAYSEKTDRGRLYIGALRKAGISEQPPSK
ncbi:MAG TPA: adenylate/guanylate cyclase domain-containing protein [Desulfobacterales bacterium]|nr:adenylate/guanylate cyclase domain-containing protein [Desulfobacterales bacterium]